MRLLFVALSVDVVRAKGLLSGTDGILEHEFVGVVLDTLLGGVVELFRPRQYLVLLFPRWHVDLAQVPADAAQRPDLKGARPRQKEHPRKGLVQRGGRHQRAVVLQHQDLVGRSQAFYQPLPLVDGIRRALEGVVGQAALGRQSRFLADGQQAEPRLTHGRRIQGVYVPHGVGVRPAPVDRRVDHKARLEDPPASPVAVHHVPVQVDLEDRRGPHFVEARTKFVDEKVRAIQDIVRVVNLERDVVENVLVPALHEGYPVTSRQLAALLPLDFFLGNAASRIAFFCRVLRNRRELPSSFWNNRTPDLRVVRAMLSSYGGWTKPPQVANGCSESVHVYDDDDAISDFYRVPW
ncbi:unnamed protein product [Pseudo-nitzschia multistriata]|uniref:Secreted protein n=1 Tax=Pseudo-nitzschia multistriata TaxID=183589 RepID=A0A448Z8D0_9STRA|nr:unnamed protein product [Pseudo-nitzschia multistriata]